MIRTGPTGTERFTQIYRKCISNAAFFAILHIPVTLMYKSVVGEKILTQRQKDNIKIDIINTVGRCELDSCVSE
jgi:hypothetical protein